MEWCHEVVWAGWKVGLRGGDRGGIKASTGIGGVWMNVVVCAYWFGFLYGVFLGLCLLGGCGSIH